jgi:Translocase of chloroplast 159/132, membrane anchor domain
VRCPQAVKDKESRTFVGSLEGSTWLGKNLSLTTATDSQTIGANDMLFTARVEPRVKWLQVRGSRRMKTSVGFLAARRGGSFKPHTGPMARGWRAEQRVRITKGLKLIATAAQLQGKSSLGTEVGRAVGVEGVLKPQDSIEGLEVSAGYNSMRTARLANGRRLGSNVVHGGTLAMQKHVSPETILNGRVQLNSGGQSMLGVRVTSHDKLATRWAFVVPLIGFILDKLFRRSQDAADF